MLENLIEPLSNHCLTQWLSGSEGLNYPKIMYSVYIPCSFCGVVVCSEQGVSGSLT